MKENTELNSKYNTYDHLSRFKCIEDNEIIEIEKKVNKFIIDEKYDFGSVIQNASLDLPKLNTDLSKIASYYKNDNTLESPDVLVKEIENFNKYYEKFSSLCNMQKKETVKEQNIIYFLYQFMSRVLFYILLSNNFIVTEDTSAVFLKFFKNYKQVINTTQLYFSDKKNVFNEYLIKAFEELKKYPNEFKDAIVNCQNFLTLILCSLELNNPEEEEETKINYSNKEMGNLLKEFIYTVDILFKVNQKYSIIDYKNFYNDGLSNKINLGREFKIYIRNQRIQAEKDKKEEDKKEEKKDDKKEDNKEDKKEDNKINVPQEENNIDFDEESSGEDEMNIIMNFNRKQKPKYKIEFTLLNYMWLFNPSAKSEIIFLFNDRKKRTQIINTINSLQNQDDLFGGFFGRMIPSKDIFLIINIRRNNLIEDTLNEVSKPGIKLQNPIKVKFIGEQGVDEGGVRKEFFMLLTRQLFDPNYGMFSYNEKTRLYWFNYCSFEPKIKYELIGIILGLAIFNSIILDIKFPLAVYKKLLGIKPTLDDLKECDPETYKSMKFLLDTNDKNLKENLDLNFTATYDKFGEKIIVPLKKDGENIMIDCDNKNEYVTLYIDWYFNKSIDQYFSSFEKGFYKVFNKELSKILSAEELELIICGTQVLDFKELKKACMYEDGYTKDSETIKYFWEILLEFNEEQKKKFLFFVTGCDRAPIDGLGSLQITISNGGTDLNQLPSAHTCFNNLILPDYKNKEVLKKKIYIAINYSEGFGLI